MKFKAWISYLLVFILLLVFLPVSSVNAASDGPRVYKDRGVVNAGFVPDEIVVKFKNDHKPFRVIKAPEGKVKEKVQEYALRPDVVYAEPNYYAQAYAAPNDPLYKYQWNFADPANGGIGMEAAWGQSTGGGVIVAIIDTGIAYESYGGYVQAPDLAGTAFVPGYDFVNNDNHANDDNSHGTHVAGTVAQSTNNGVGVAGIAYNAKLMPIKVLDKRGSGSYANIALGIRYAADNGAKVINMSLGGPVPAQVLEDALAYAYGLGVTIVAAAGNDATGTVGYPAAYDAYVIAVGATRLDKQLAYYSNWGTSLDLVAPGGDVNVDQNGDGYGDGILQNTFNPSTKRVGDFGYYFFQGTSMASPHVAGAAALVIANGIATKPADVQKVLQDTAVDLGAAGRDDRYGYGLVNVAAALGQPVEPPVNQAPTADSQSVSTKVGTPVAITLTASDPDDDVLLFSIVNGPTSGALSGEAPNLTYTPSVGFTGTDSFSFKANDSKLDSNIAVVTITVTADSAGTTLEIGISMTTQSKKAGKNTFVWAVATVSTGLEGATVTGHWEGATTDLDSGTTAANGTVVLQSDQIKWTGEPVTFIFVVDQMTKDGIIYELTGTTQASVPYPSDGKQP
jgi:serine protease